MSNKSTFVGRVVEVQPTEKLGKDPSKPFLKRVIVVDDSEEGSKYPNPVPFEAIGDKCEYLDGYKVGEVVTIDYYPSGRPWSDPKTKKTRYFASFRIAYISKGEKAAEVAATDEIPESDPEDMPF